MNDSLDKIKKLADENLEFTRLWVEMLAISIDTLSAIALTKNRVKREEYRPRSIEKT